MGLEVWNYAHLWENVMQKCVWNQLSNVIPFQCKYLAQSKCHPCCAEQVVLCCLKQLWTFFLNSMNTLNLYLVHVVYRVLLNQCIWCKSRFTWGSKHITLWFAHSLGHRTRVLHLSKSILDGSAEFPSPFPLFESYKCMLFLYQQVLFFPGYYSRLPQSFKRPIFLWPAQTRMGPYAEIVWGANCPNLERPVVKQLQMH